MAEEPIDVVFFGDSITNGQNVSEEKSWRGIIAAALGDLCFHNYGVNGDTSRLGLLRYPQMLREVRPQIVFVQFGMNDCNWWKTDHGHPRVSKAAFEANMAEFISRARAFDVKCVFMLTNHYSNKKNEFGSHYWAVRDYNEVVRGVCKKTWSKLIDIEDRIKDYENILLDDGYGVHLNEKGNLLYASFILPELLWALDRLV